MNNEIGITLSKKAIIGIVSLLISFVSLPPIGINHFSSIRNKTVLEKVAEQEAELLEQMSGQEKVMSDLLIEQKEKVNNLILDVVELKVLIREINRNLYDINAKVSELDGMMKNN